MDQDIAGQPENELSPTAGSENVILAGEDLEPTNDDVMSSGTWIDVNCIDGQHSETLPAPEVNLDDVIDTYNPDEAFSFIIAVLDRRYPIGTMLIERGVMADFGHCVDLFLRDRASPQSIFQQLTTIVHECGHFADIDAGMFRSDVYLITSEINFSCIAGDAVGRQNGRTFARSLINEDEYALDACFGGASCDFYRDVYLNGDPNNETFEGGDQGYNSLLEETTQYINSLAVGYSLHDKYTRGSVSERDGILTFLWYVTRYLKMARESYPEAYTFIVNDTCWRELTLTLWGRAWLYLELTEGLPMLGINDAVIESRLTPELVSEIERLRDIQCRSN